MIKSRLSRTPYDVLPKDVLMMKKKNPLVWLDDIRVHGFVLTGLGKKLYKNSQKFLLIRPLQ